MFENLHRLAMMGWNITVYAYNFGDWPSDIPVKWIEVPGKKIPTNLLKNLWFSLYTYFALKNTKIPVMTAGTCSWQADIRVVHFVHKSFLSLIKKGRAPYPNDRTIIHRLYQMLFARIEVAFEHLFFKHTKLFISVSKQIAKEVDDLVRPKKIPSKVIYHAPDAATYIKEKHGNRFLFVGALDRKGIDKALRVLSLLPSQDWTFDVVGTGDLPRWKKLAESLGINERVIFHGATPAAEFFAASDFLIFPSNYEPFGLVVSEAASNHCLPIASSECGAMELWRDRPEWLKLSSTDDDALWAAAIEKVFFSRDLRHQLITSCRSDFSKWSWDQSAKAYEDALLPFMRQA
ncbi:MAG: hypothetical protein CME71_05015 [Halobacteriovorax sp.]|nr:hypothetical protein [Halobacteriovorax sp.]